jgi:hypothetical protein
MDQRSSGDQRLRRVTRDLIRAFERVGLPVALVTIATSVVAVGQDAREQVSPFYGSFSSSVPIEVAPYHGLEPKLALAYTSEGHNGFVGVGWSLGGVSVIERVNGGRGTPRGDASDIFLLDGQELAACQTGSVSPSCTTGGTHSTKVESHLRIAINSTANTWAVTGRDGTRTTFSPMVASQGLTVRWGQTATADTYGNTVSYAWACVDGDCYPDRISYNRYSVALLRESRPDPLSFGAGHEIGRTQHRLGLIVVQLGAQLIRAYKLTYATSAVTGRSLLTSVQQYGRDAVTQGTAVVSGTALPAQTFSYSSDSSGHTLNIRSANRPPSAALSHAGACATNGVCTATFSASTSDPDSDPLAYTWSGCATGSANTLACTRSGSGSLSEWPSLRCFRRGGRLGDGRGWEGARRDLVECG